MLEEQRERCWQQHTSKRFFFIPPPSLQASCLHQGLARRCHFCAAKVNPMEDNVATSALSVSRVAKAQFYISSTPVAVNRQLFYSLDFANTFVHAAVGGVGLGGWGCVCLILFGEIEKKSMNIYPLPSFPTSVIFSIGFRNESHQGCAVIGEGIVRGLGGVPRVRRH